MKTFILNFTNEENSRYYVVLIIAETQDKAQLFANEHYHTNEVPEELPLEYTGDDKETDTLYTRVINTKQT